MITRQISAPAPLPGGHGEDVPNAFAGIEILAATDLTQSKEFASLEQAERLERALDEQRQLLSGVLDPELDAVFDLRMLIDPSAEVPLSVGLIMRTWADDEAEAESASDTLAGRIEASMPRHVVFQRMGEDRLESFLEPFGDSDLHGAFLTREEVMGQPQRPDAGADYYFSVLPLTQADVDWSNLYQSLTKSPEPLLVSVALLPVLVPDAFGHRLDAIASEYGRLASEGESAPSLARGKPSKLAPDTFAVDAAPVFQDFSRRLTRHAFMSRIAIASPRPIKPGILTTLASGISPPIGRDQEEQGATMSAYPLGVTVANSPELTELLEWDVTNVDICHDAGNQALWDRDDAPPDDLRLLSVLMDPPDASRAFRLPIALTGRVPGFRVREGAFGQVEVAEIDGPSIVLGELEGTSDPFRVSVNDLTKHALVVGSTGSGKTTTILELLRQLWVDHEIPFLVIEPVNSNANDYRRFIEEPGFEELEVITVGDEESCPLRFNPFEVPEGTLIGEHEANLLACFKAAFGLFEPLPAIYEEAINATYFRLGLLSAQEAEPGTRWPTVTDFLSAMREATQDLSYEGEVKSNIEAASVIRAQSLVKGPCSSTFLTDVPNDVASLLDHPVVIELKSLGTGDEQSLMMALLLNSMTEHYQASRGAMSAVEHVTVIEEAHRLLSSTQGAAGSGEARAKAQAAEGFANTLAENRKYGEGLIIAEQIPTKLIDDAVKNTNLKLMHRLTAEEERRYVGEAMALDESDQRSSAKLKTGECIAYADYLPTAMKAKIDPLLESRRPTAPPPTISPPFEACAVCMSQCDFRGQSLALMKQKSVIRKIQGGFDPLFVEFPDPSHIPKDGWQDLSSRLAEVVAKVTKSSQQLPDAALCLFAHSLAQDDSRIVAPWINAASSAIQSLDARSSSGRKSQSTAKTKPASESKQAKNQANASKKKPAGKTKPPKRSPARKKAVRKGPAAKKANK